VTKSSSKILPAVLKSPFLWGGLAACGFYGMIYRGVLNHPNVIRYFAGHPVNYFETVFFLIGFAALVVKGLSVWRERSLTFAVAMTDPPAETRTQAKAAALLEALGYWPQKWQDSLLGRRLHDALAMLRWQGAPEKLADQMQEMAEAEVERQQESYALVRLMIWAIPILGFLGTVMGITLAIANLSATELQQSTPAIVAGLSVAFDTTAIALAFSMFLMFLQFFIERTETGVLNHVDERARDELLGRFPVVENSSDPVVSGMRKMLDALLATTDQLVQRQTALWQSTLDTAQKRWHQFGQEQQEVIQASLQNAMEKFSDTLVRVESTAAEKSQKHWLNTQETLTRTLEALSQNQREQHRQTEMLRQISTATSEISKLEHALNQNLSALAGTRQFDEMLLTLTAALHLLTGRLSTNDEQLKQIHLKAALRPESHAA